jgi:hypothetical protein
MNEIATTLLDSVLVYTNGKGERVRGRVRCVYLHEHADVRVIVEDILTGTLRDKLVTDCYGERP